MKKRGTVIKPTAIHSNKRKTTNQTYNPKTPPTWGITDGNQTLNVTIKPTAVYSSSKRQAKTTKNYDTSTMLTYSIAKSIDNHFTISSTSAFSKVQ